MGRLVALLLLTGCGGFEAVDSSALSNNNQALAPRPAMNEALRGPPLAAIGDPCSAPQECDTGVCAMANGAGPFCLPTTDTQ